jgi:preprotein translocase subunit SecD
MGRQRWLLMVILVLVAASVFVLSTMPLKLGLDLRGGSQLTIQVNPSETIKVVGERELEAVQKVIENRINGLGVSEPVVQTIGQNQISVQLPGVDDPTQAERVLGGTAQLEFREQKAGSEAQFGAENIVLRELQIQQAKLRTTPDQKVAIDENTAAIKRSAKAIADLFEKPSLIGKDLTDAYPAQTSPQQWAVGINFSKEGGDKFAEMTKRLAGTGRSIGIFLDGVPISTPTVAIEYAQTGIQGGGATISGNFDAKSANELGIQLKGGSLPLPIQIVENRTVGASLGRDSIQRSVYAGLGGLFLVFVFMIVYYRLLGAIASIALVIYSLLTLAAFSVLGVTLTLPGIAGFILSIGMAVDANVLIFERTKEELRTGKTLYRAVESGFSQAFSSIFDSNLTTLIACGALFWLGAGLVRGFALTLALGVAVSMFTALTCSRTLLLYVLTIPSLRKPEWFCPGISKLAPTTTPSEAA